MWLGGDMTGFWVMSLISGVIGLVITIGIIVLIVLGIRWLLRQERTSGPATAGGGDSLDILRARYARGEIDDEEFERRRRILSSG